MIKNFRCYNLAKEFYAECEKIQLKGYLKDQFDRAALSIMLNLAEGSAKKTPKERNRIYQIAWGSMRECHAILEIVGPEGNVARTLADKLAASIYCLVFK